MLPFSSYTKFPLSSFFSCSSVTFFIDCISKFSCIDFIFSNPSCENDFIDFLFDICIVPSVIGLLVFIVILLFCFVYSTIILLSSTSFISPVLYSICSFLFFFLSGSPYFIVAILSVPSLISMAPSVPSILSNSFLLIVVDL